MSESGASEEMSRNAAGVVCLLRFGTMSEREKEPGRNKPAYCLPRLESAVCFIALKRPSAFPLVNAPMAGEVRAYGFGRDYTKGYGHETHFEKIEKVSKELSRS
jgi:hypothetical protein